MHTLAQTVPFVQAPFASHVCGVRPLHCFAPGAHTPVHAPVTHAWFAHAEVAPHCPLVLQAWTPLPTHCVAPGTHTPEHAPPTHADDTHAEAAPHWPFAVQVCTPLFEQRFAPGAHTPVQDPLAQAWFEHVVPSKRNRAAMVPRSRCSM